MALVSTTFFLCFQEMHGDGEKKSFVELLQVLHFGQQYVLKNGTPHPLPHAPPSGHLSPQFASSPLRGWCKNYLSPAHRHANKKKRKFGECFQLP
jgi:hypothetical protein